MKFFGKKLSGEDLEKAKQGIWPVWYLIINNYNRAKINRIMEKNREPWIDYMYNN